MNILSVFSELLAQSGFAAITWQQGVMLLVSFVLLYLAIKKQFEPVGRTIHLKSITITDYMHILSKVSFTIKQESEQRTKEEMHRTG